MSSKKLEDMSIDEAIYCMKNAIDSNLTCKNCDYIEDAGCRAQAHKIAISALKEKKKINDELAKAMLAGDGTTDNVNHPSHYESSTSLECIESMEIMFGESMVTAFCLLNAYKYIWRYKHKNGLEDLKKAKWYLDYILKNHPDKLGFEEDTNVRLRDYVKRHIVEYSGGPNTTGEK